MASGPFSVPMIMMTTSAFSEEDKAEAFRIGVDAFLRKPFGIIEFRTVVEASLEKINPPTVIEPP